MEETATTSSLEVLAMMSSMAVMEMIYCPEVRETICSKENMGMIASMVRTAQTNFWAAKVMTTWTEDMTN